MNTEIKQPSFKKVYLFGGIIVLAVAAFGVLRFMKTSSIAQATPVRDASLASKPVPLDLSPATLKAKQPPLPSPPP